MQSKAATVGEYLASLPPDRRTALEAVRRVILENLDKDYVERMSYGMIGYAIPHSVYPAGYHCDPKQPLPFAGLASQSGHMSVYLMCLYGNPSQERQFREAWAKAGKKLDMGKSCIRFKKVEDLALDVLADAIRRTPASTYIKHYEANVKRTGKQSAAAKPAKGAAANSKPVAKPASKAKKKPKTAARTPSKAKR